MKIGDLVRQKKHFGKERVGIIWTIGSPVPIARILWSDGQQGAINIRFLEVISEKR
tara:strand:- start:130 stop:297 length:168 start_codon:yes stop_codon:yes gene_type:complete